MDMSPERPLGAVYARCWFQAVNLIFKRFGAALWDNESEDDFCVDAVRGACVLLLSGILPACCRQYSCKGLVLAQARVLL